VNDAIKIGVASQGVCDDQRAGVYVLPAEEADREGTGFGKAQRGLVDAGRIRGDCRGAGRSDAIAGPGAVRKRGLQLILNGGDGSVVGSGAEDDELVVLHEDRAGIVEIADQLRWAGEGHRAEIVDEAGDLPEATEGAVVEEEGLRQKSAVHRDSARHVVKQN